MGSDSNSEERREGFGPDAMEQVMRERIRATIERLVDEELVAALGAGKSGRVGEQRTGYRHGTRPRTLSTSLGPTTFRLPRARLHEADGGTREWRSTVIPRYGRRTQRVDEALLGVYLSGANTRRIRGALAPLLRDTPLSKRRSSRRAPRSGASGSYAAPRRGRASRKPEDELFTFVRYPVSQWKALRTTNALERINEEFCRRTKTQASLPSEEAVLLLLFGLVRSGQIVLRRLVGWQNMGSASKRIETA